MLRKKIGFRIYWQYPLQKDKTLHKKRKEKCPEHEIEFECEAWDLSSVLLTFHCHYYQVHFNPE